MAGATNADDLRLTVPCDRRAPAAVREAVHGCGTVQPVLGDALLVASELVTNAVLHSGCKSEETLEVCVRRTDRAVAISVHDPGTSGTTAAPVEAISATSGYGLWIIERLSQRWGHERTDGYRVWAELALPH